MLYNSNNQSCVIDRGMDILINAPDPEIGPNKYTQLIADQD